MKKLVKNISLFPVLILVASISLLSCGGGGGGDSTSTVGGTVASVEAAMTPMEERSSMLAQLRDFFFLKKANAQGSSVEGITVTIQKGGEDVATATTDSNGDFNLTVPSGNATLSFDTGDFTASTEVFVPAGGALDMVVTLHPDEVEVDETEVDGTIRCENGDVNIEAENFMINGGGEDDCIRVEGNCSLNIKSNNITLDECGRCIDAEGTAEATLTATGTTTDGTTADGNISCSASEDGIRSSGNATVNLNTIVETASASANSKSASGGNITINSNEGADESTLVSSDDNEDDDGNDGDDGDDDEAENGIRAEGNSNTSLTASGDINITGEENGIRASGNPTVEVGADGECTIQGGEDAIQQEGNATVNTGDCALINGEPEPTPTPSPGE